MSGIELTPLPTVLRDLPLALTLLELDSTATAAAIAAGRLETLTRDGLYRYLRNPMYVAVMLTVLGQVMVLGRPVLLLYALVFGIAVGKFVHFSSKPTLTRQFGAVYEAYGYSVPAWLPRRRPWRQGDLTERSEDAGR